MKTARERARIATRDSNPARTRLRCPDLGNGHPARLSDRASRPRRTARILAFAWGAWCTGFYSLMLLSFVLQPIQDELRPLRRGRSRR